MDPSMLKSRWPQWRVALQERFEKLEASDLAAIGGEVSLLVESLQHRYGWDRERAEIEVAAALESPPVETTAVPLAAQARATLGPAAAKLREGFTELGQGLRELAGEAAQQAGDGARARSVHVAEVAASAQARAQEALGEAGEVGQRWLKQTEQFVRERPLTAVGIAFVAGWLLLGRR
ncbi:MAG TPA: hypothetical protein PLI00_08240 [Pseudomonadota bacterium]|nr:hypothetical protein [Pseudomonadota bacterium]HRA37631.1 hypothetical protein [Pseudomonadota bacterium]